MATTRSQRKYKIRLSTGRTVGPIDSQKIEKLIKKGHIRGDELVQEFPDGEWKPLGTRAELAQLLFGLASGKETTVLGPLGERSSSSISASRELEATAVLPVTKVIAKDEAPAAAPEPQEPPASAVQTAHSLVKPPIGAEPSTGEALEDPTEVREPLENESLDEKTKVEVSVSTGRFPQVRNLSQESTVLFQRSTDSKKLPGKRHQERKGRYRNVFAGVLLLFVLFEFGEEMFGKANKIPERVQEFRPRLPVVREGQKPDPARSQREYSKGLKFYSSDTIPGYKKAAVYFRTAAELDPDNLRAVAMLASSYLNLIDASNKDENYFSIISKLIEMSKAKGLELTETLIAEIEFLIFSQKPGAAQARIIEYTKSHKNYDDIFILYAAKALASQGDYPTSARYLSRIPDGKPYSVRAHYLRGQVAEGLMEPEAAARYYGQAVQLSPEHGMARYRFLKILESQGRLAEGKKHVLFFAKNPGLIPARDLAQVYSWGANLAEAAGEVQMALGYVERALRLDGENSAYNLQYYLLRARAGDKVATLRKEARLYYYLAEGERLAREGKIEEAIFQFIEARRESPRSPLPLIKRGELFYNFKKDIVNARISYKKATELAPRNVKVWSKYIEILIQSYEWDEASAAIKKLRTLPLHRETVLDKITGDWYARQGNHTEAISYYKRALARSYIDPSVYLAFGKSLLKMKRFDLAPAVFSLALRFDPENIEAIVGISEAVAGSEGLDKAFAYLSDEIRKGRATRVELLCAMASILTRKGLFDQAEQYIQQAKAIGPDSAQPWKVEAELSLAMGADKRARERASQAYRAYLDRNPSDAEIMYERYRVLLEAEKYEEADHELGRIYEAYPKFPGLHFSKGQIYIRLLNFQAAIQEFEKEIKNGNNSVSNLIELGKAHFELKQLDTALEYFVRAIQKSPTNAQAKFHAGRANFSLGRHQAAIALLQEAIKLEEGNPVYYRHLGYVYRAMGDLNGMRWAFGKYLEMEPDAMDRAEIQRNM